MHSTPMRAAAGSTRVAFHYQVNGQRFETREDAHMFAAKGTPQVARAPRTATRGVTSRKDNLKVESTIGTYVHRGKEVVEVAAGLITAIDKPDVTTDLTHLAVNVFKEHVHCLTALPQKEFEAARADDKEGNELLGKVEKGFRKIMVDPIAAAEGLIDFIETSRDMMAEHQEQWNSDNDADFRQYVTENVLIELPQMLEKADQILEMHKGMARASIELEEEFEDAATDICTESKTVMESAEHGTMAGIATSGGGGILAATGGIVAAVGSGPIGWALMATGGAVTLAGGYASVRFDLVRRRKQKALELGMIIKNKVSFNMNTCELLKKQWCRLYERIRAATARIARLGGMFSGCAPAAKSKLALKEDAEDADPRHADIIDLNLNVNHEPVNKCDRAFLDDILTSLVNIVCPAREYKELAKRAKSKDVAASFDKGDRVLYRGQHATVTAVDRRLDPPGYEVKIDGSRRVVNVEAEHLEPLSPEDDDVYGEDDELSNPDSDPIDSEASEESEESEDDYDEDYDDYDEEDEEEDGDSDMEEEEESENEDSDEVDPDSDEVLEESEKKDSDKASSKSDLRREPHHYAGPS